MGKLNKKDSEFYEICRKHGFLESAMDINETRMDRNHSKITILIRWKVE